MEYRTADGFTLTDEMLEAEAALLERGERPEGWEENKPVNVTLPEKRPPSQTRPSAAAPTTTAACAPGR